MGSTDKTLTKAKINNNYHPPSYHLIIEDNQVVSACLLHTSMLLVLNVFGNGLLENLLLHLLRDCSETDQPAGCILSHPMDLCMSIFFQMFPNPGLFHWIFLAVGLRNPRFLKASLTSKNWGEESIRYLHLFYVICNQINCLIQQWTLIFLLPLIYLKKFPCCSHPLPNINLGGLLWLFLPLVCILSVCIFLLVPAFTSCKL